MNNQKDFRIGNYIFSKETGNIQKITGITDENPFFDSITFDYPNWDEIEPIPITEEYLLKFGFAKNTDVPYRWYFDDFFFDLDDFTFCFYGYWLDRKIEYVHELQNIIYELKRIEL